MTIVDISVRDEELDDCKKIVLRRGAITWKIRTMLSALVTYHQTIIFIDAEGRFRHRAPEMGMTNFVIDAVDGSSDRIHRGAGSGVSVVPVDGRHPAVALRGAGGYLSATPDGRCIEVDSLNGWEFFSPMALTTLQAMQYEPTVRILQKPRSFSIPRLLHQTFPTRDVPERFRDNIDRLRSDNADWRYTLWDDKDVHDFIYQHYGWDVLKHYLRINPRYGAARADLFRYLLIYQMGGAYFDIKSSCRVPLDQLVSCDDQYILSQWDHGVADMSATFGLWPELVHVKGGEYQQWHVIAAPGHPFLERVISRVLSGIHDYDENAHGVGPMATLRTTGPIAYTLAIEPALPDHPHRILPSDQNPFIYINVENYHSHVKTYRTQTTPLIL